MTHQNDDAVEKVLTALNKAAPPEGMEARIAHRLQQQPATPSTSLAAVWWRGALTGATAAALAISGVMMLQHRSLRPQVGPQTSPIPAATTPVPSIATTPVALHPAQPCSSPAILRLHKAATVPQIAIAREEAVQPSRPAAAPPLTAEERGLVRLAHIASPKELATLNPEVQAKLEAQEEADFTKFFTPPPRPKPVDENE